MIGITKCEKNFVHRLGGGMAPCAPPGSATAMNISDTARNRTHNLFRPKREPIPLGHSDGWEELVILSYTFLKFAHYSCFWGHGIHCWYFYIATTFRWPPKSRKASGPARTRGYWWLWLVHFWPSTRATPSSSWHLANTISDCFWIAPNNMHEKCDLL